MYDSYFDVSGGKGNFVIDPLAKRKTTKITYFMNYLKDDSAIRRPYSPYSALES